ncbi:MAG: TMEM175 family protein [Clostridiales Family XIII bacterium]|jgi:uncharacterized membrane protein|nr:TMEM175 family protein [Clostridiales Family XIII bacterium]
MNKSRLEAFTDAVIAIIMTILVLELEMPESASFTALWGLRFQFLIYLVSFLTLAIYWNNHHHMFQASRHVSGKVMWLNIMLLLLLSLFPFTTAWMSHHVNGRAPELLFGIIMLAADIGWVLVGQALCEENGPDSLIAKAVRSSGVGKSKITIALVSAGIAVGIWVPMATLVACALSLIPWIIPDRDIEKWLHEKKGGEG